MRKALKIIFFLILGFCCQISMAQNSPAPAQPLPVDSAFQFSATASNYQTIIASWKIAPGYHLYQNQFKFKVLRPAGTVIGEPLMPEGIKKHSKEIGEYQAYINSVSIPIPVIKSNGKNLILQVTYQGCANKGFCYPPMTKVVPIDLSGNYGVPVQGVEVDVPPATKTTTKQHTPTEINHIEKLLKGKSLFGLILSFIGFGLLISLTPCVLPMIPILSSIIIGQKKITTVRSFGLSIAYVLGMAITYAIAGMIFGYIGGSISAMLQRPWIIAAFSLVFVLLALSMFGFYDIQLPEKFRSKLAHASDHQKRGTYIGAAVMGIFSTLILSPCVTPPLVAVLTYISQTGNANLGGIALFFMGLGMGAPLLIIGASGGKLLPKAGPWMVAIKNLMGILLLAVAIYMVDRILPGKIIMLMWAALAIGSSIYFGAFTSVKGSWGYLKKSLGLILFIYGIVLIIGTTLGNTNPLQPLNFNATSTTAKTELPFITVKTIDDVSKQIALAKKAGKPVMLDFYADWCIACKELDHFTFSDPTVKEELKRFVLLRADVTRNDVEDKMLERHFHVIAPPTILFFNKQGHEIKSARIIGSMDAKEFLQHLQKISDERQTPN